MYDAELYRNKAEVEEWKRRDPIDLFVQQLRVANLLNDAELADAEGYAGQEVATAVAFAEAGPWEPVTDLTRDVYTPIAAPSNDGSLAARA
jgi:pyruvate dehydrogenase E1 component alpha subunit